MINDPINVKNYLPRHYTREYPVFVEFLQLYFKYLHRTQNLSPEAFMARVQRFVDNGMTQTAAERHARTLMRKRPATEFRDQLPYTRKPREYHQVAALDLLLKGQNGEKLLFRSDNKIENDAMMADRGMKSFFNKLSDGIKGIDPVRFYRLMSDFKHCAGSKKFIELYFSWLYDGEIEVFYPKEYIIRPDDTFILDESTYHLRDDSYYSEFSYVVRAHGEPKVYNPNVFISMYKNHFHPSGFGLVVETDENVMDVTYDYPVLIPAKTVGSYYQLSRPINLDTGDSIELTVMFTTSLSDDLSGNIFDGLTFDGTYFHFDENELDVYLDGTKIFESTQIELDDLFHKVNVVVAGEAPLSIETFLKADEVTYTTQGGMPIERIVATIDGSVVCDYRVNTLSESGVADSLTPWTMLTQLEGMYEFDDEENAVKEITELLEPNSMYLVFANGANTSGQMTLALGSKDDTQSIIDFEQASASVTAFVNETLMNALDENGTEPASDPETDDYVTPTGTIDFDYKRYYWNFFTTEDTQTKLVATSATGLNKVQFVVWKVTGGILTFERINENLFSDTGFWIQSPDAYTNEDFEESLASIRNVEALIDRLSVFVNLTLPLSTLIEEPWLTAERLKQDEKDLRAVITQTLFSGLSTDNPYDIAVSNYANSTESLNYFINNVLPNAVKNFDQADQDLAGEMSSDFENNSLSLEEFINQVLPDAMKRYDD